MKIFRGLLLAVTAACAQSSSDPAEILAQTRDRAVEAAGHLSKYSCTQTIDRSYFSRAKLPDPAPSCDQISVDRGKGRYKLSLYETDRVRVKVLATGGREAFAWSSPLPFETHDIEEVLESGPISTGAFGGYLMNLFGSPEAHFQFVAAQGGKLQYAFRESSDAGRQVIKAGGRWAPAARSGTFVVNRGSHDVERLVLETSALPRDTSMCESAEAIDYGRVGSSNEDVLLPRHAELRNVMINTQETTSASAYTSCVAMNSAEPLEASILPVNAASSSLPEKYKIVLQLDDSIDTDTVAGGDVVSATVVADVVARDRRTMLLRAGTKVRGRILSSAHVLDPGLGAPGEKVAPGRYFAIAISFDVAEIDGAAAPLRVRLDRPRMTAGSSRWPEQTLVFSTARNRYVVPRGFMSIWVTVK